MPVEFDPWRELIRVFPTIVSLEVGRYVITAGLFSIIIWAFWRPVLGALVIGGALMAVFRVKRQGWLFPLVVGLSFALHESIEWLSVARAIFWYEYNFAVSGLPAPFVERLVTLESIARALFFGAGVGATLQWHKLRAEDSDDEYDDDVSDDGM